MDMQEYFKTFWYVKYVLPNGCTFLLTSRPDAYAKDAVDAFVKEHKPNVRFQFTDDLTTYKDGPHFHWYPWVPGKKLPTELVWAAVSLITTYAVPGKVVWMHCDSSSMRAPTFFGHFLRTQYSDEEIKYLVSKVAWTDGRPHSDPLYYSDVSLKSDPGMQELMDAWRSGGNVAAYAQIMKVKNSWEES